MAGARGVARDSKPPRRRPARDRVAEEKLADLERALEARVAEAIEAKDTVELLRLRTHFAERVLTARAADPAADDESSTPAADDAVARF